MLDYLKQKLKKLPQKDFLSFPRYYEENGVLIKETASGIRYEIELDADHHEKIIRRIQS